MIFVFDLDDTLYEEITFVKKWVSCSSELFVPRAWSFVG